MRECEEVSKKPTWAARIYLKDILLMAPLYKKYIYNLEEVKKIRDMACCGEINIYIDHNEIIYNLCGTIEKLEKEKNYDEKEKK